MSHLACAGLLLASTLLCPAQHKWETVQHNGHEYVTARSIRDFYRFKTLDVRNNRLALENQFVKCSFSLQEPEAFMNNMRFHLEFPVVRQGERFLISRLTLAKTIDPVLRPTWIRGAPPLDEIIIHPEAMPAAHQGADLTLRLAQAMQRKLQALRFQVTLTRDQARAPGQDELLELFNRPGNSSVIILRVIDDPAEPAGLRTWILAPAGVPALGRRLAQEDLGAQPGNRHDALNVALAASLHGAVLVTTGRPDLGIARSRDPLLARSERPALLLRIGNLAAADEAALLPGEAFQSRLADAIGKGFSRARVALRERK